MPPAHPRPKSRPKSRRRRPPSAAQKAWLARGLEQPGGKLPLFDADGGPIRRRIVESCLEAGWAERWFNNPLKPDWLICRLTDAGRAALSVVDAGPAVNPAETVNDTDTENHTP